MKLRNTAVFLACAMLVAAMTGCGKEETPSASQEVKQGKHHITVESVEITLAELKEKNYTVPVCVRLDKNAGINYSEWGVKVDKRCTFAVDEETEDLAFVVYHSINEKENFLWTAWASGGQVNTTTGNLMWLNVTLPRTAAAGDRYDIEYADWSKADKPHIWSGQDEDWAKNGDVTWVDGVITVK